MRSDGGRPNFFPADFGLLGTNLNRQTLAAFFSASGKDFTAVFRLHALAKPVSLRAFLLTGLPRAFHENFLQAFVGRSKGAAQGGDNNMEPKSPRKNGPKSANEPCLRIKETKRLSSLARPSLPNSLVQPPAFLLSVPNVFSSSSFRLTKVPRGASSL